MRQNNAKLRQLRPQHIDRKNDPKTGEIPENQNAYMAATNIGRMVEEGNKISFHRAFSHEAAGLANDLDITDVGARKLMSEAFEDSEGRELREWGKELDEKYFRSQIKAEQKQQSENKTYSRSRQPSQA